MTDDNSKKSGDHMDVPVVTDQAEPKSNFARAAADKKNGDKGGKKADKSRSGSGWLWLLLAAALVGGGGAWAWYNWPQFQAGVQQAIELLPDSDKRESTATVAAPADDTPTGTGESAASPEPATPSPAEAGSRDSAIPQPVAPDSGARVSTPPHQPGAQQAAQQAQAMADMLRELNQQRTTVAQLRQQLAQLQRELAAQSSRLGELGNVSRTDWQLAEADYLLRLANQRLLLERDSRAALGLLEEVDRILRRVDRPDLYGVRQQLARDITDLKMAEDIDQQGLYLRLGALQEQMLKASIQPEFDLAMGASGEEAPDDTADSTQPAWERSWENFTSFLKDSVRIRDGDIDPVLLSPQSEARFRQSLRLNMEQAQLAVLRGDSTVYRDSLKSARQLLLDYGIANQRRDALVRELESMAKEPIEAELPDLNASQKALHDYIERLHNTSPGPAEDGGATS
ncbi:uroporphyrinogen-III C-methyltransferase [Microbulbifer sp. YPW16]|uniref:uroporphyrinogen-III C-methyltransferase n=1 Tax=Microbulbifer sp. YPW16 TaxID=2904242 RepID=UPI001E33DDB8|nr:uroporphyrinogen-III C-methyltransferase [Microbulbifer sp. YPW16]UHQ54249.1 uroporphyrinogen-III C-methyltransferase [Microbulbifer sp. YPW16]